MEEKYNSSGTVTEAKDSTTWQMSNHTSGSTKKRKKPESTSFTHEYHPTNKSLIYSVRSQTSRDNILNINLSQTLGQESTLKKKVCYPFWTKCSQDVSDKLWSCTGTDYVDLPSTSWNASLKRLGLNSWFSTKMSMPRNKKNWLPISSPSPQFLWQDIMDAVLPKIERDEEKKKKPRVKKPKQETKTKETPPAKRRKLEQVKAKKTKTKLPVKTNNKPNKAVAERCKKIRVYPTHKQRKILEQWFGTARWTYNHCVEYDRGHKKSGKGDLRKYCINSDSELVTEWVKQTPYEIRDQAMLDIIKAKKTIKANNHKNAEFKFRSRKDKTQTIGILAKAYNAKNGQTANVIRHLKAIYNKQDTKLPDRVNYDCKLTKTWLGEYYFIIPEPLICQSESQAPVHQHQGDGVIAIDPGVRTFATGFEASGTYYEWGKKDIGRIQRLCYHYDQLRSKIDENKSELTKRRRYLMRRASRKISRKIRRLVDEFHKKLCKWLCENFHAIILPVFESSKMVKKTGVTRRIGSKTARNMLTWSHYRFRERLKNKVQEYPWVKLYLVSEEYTSKTCGQCGHIHQKLGGSKVFECPSCGLKLDRDVNGARNILVKFLTNVHSLYSSENKPASVVYPALGSLALG